MYTKISDPNTPCLQMLMIGHKAQKTEEDALAGLASGLKTLLKYAFVSLV
jgi:hypothetical protein